MLLAILEFSVKVIGRDGNLAWSFRALWQA